MLGISTVIKFKIQQKDTIDSCKFKWKRKGI